MDDDQPQIQRSIDNENDNDNDNDRGDNDGESNIEYDDDQDASLSKATDLRNNSDENERKLPNERRINHLQHEARLKSSNYNARDTGNIVLVTGSDDIKKEFDYQIYSRDLKYHFELDNPTMCYSITKIKEINDDNILIIFADAETARTAVSDANTMYLMGNWIELDLRFVNKNNSNTTGGNRPISKNFKRVDIIDAMAQAAQ